jgi:methylase of polypeptide subunit release factors
MNDVSVIRAFPARPINKRAREGGRGMDGLEKENARRSVLEKLGISSFVTTAALDISAGHSLHVEQQRTPARFIIDGLTIDAPAGVYHPTPESSSLLFIRNIMAMNKPKIPKTLEIGAGCGAISLFVAHRWKSTVVATDIAPEALEAIRKNARLNDIAIEPVHSDLFDRVEDRDFDLIVFNAPLIDKEPESDLERSTLCDPGGQILRRFLEKAGGFLNESGLIIFSVCCNTAYEVLAGIDLKYRIIGIEVVGNGFWRAIVGGEN